MAKKHTRAIKKLMDYSFVSIKGCSFLPSLVKLSRKYLKESRNLLYPLIVIVLDGVIKVNFY